MPIKTDEEIAREVRERLNLHTTDLCELDFALVAAGRKAGMEEERERAAQLILDRDHDGDQGRG